MGSEMCIRDRYRSINNGADSFLVNIRRLPLSPVRMVSYTWCQVRPAVAVVHVLVHEKCGLAFARVVPAVSRGSRALGHLV